MDFLNFFDEDLSKHPPQQSTDSMGEIKPENV
jgi:hypothetical protein